jgi:hypothetical protein
MPEVESNGFLRVRAWLELLSFAAVVIGIIIGFADHFANRAEERRDVVESVYTALDDEYRDYLALLLQYPTVAGSHRPDDAPPPTLSADDRTRLRLLNELVIDLFERAYLEYNDPTKVALMRDTRRDQWAGWEQDIDTSLRGSEFREVWNDVGTSFDSRFQKYMQARIAALRVP